jgi:hypothetical protein
MPQPTALPRLRRAQPAGNSSAKRSFRRSKGDSFATAFDVARTRVAERERDAGYAPPANPQISVGSAMTAKLKTLRRRGAGGATADRAKLRLGA